MYCSSALYACRLLAHGYSRRCSDLAITKHVELQRQIQIAGHLKEATKLERPGYKLRTEEEIAHLHHVANQPIGNDRHAEPFAGPRLLVFQDLRQSQGRFDGQTGVAQ